MQSSAPRTLECHFSRPSISLPTRVVTEGNRMVVVVVVCVLEQVASDRLEHGWSVGWVSLCGY